MTEGEFSLGCGASTSEAPIGYFTGELYLSTTDIKSSGFVRWGFGRSYASGQTFFPQGTMGNWCDFLPLLQQTLTGWQYQNGAHGGASFSGSGTGPYSGEYYHKEALT